MKYLTGLFCLYTLIGAAQNTSEQNQLLFVSVSGTASFFSKAPLENIEAKSEEAVLALHTANGKLSARIPIRSFQFEKALMQEHFNEKYLESDRFPNATFSGHIQEKIDYALDSTYIVTVKGVLDIHGVKQERIIKGTMSVKDGRPSSIAADFNVTLKSHKIKIPKLLFQNIAELIAVNVSFNSFEPYIKK